MESTNLTKQTEDSTILESETSFLTYHCPKCYFIPKISLITNPKNEKQKLIKYSCPNNHNEEIELEKFINTYKYIPENIIKCELKKDENSFGHTPPFYYCKECNGKFYCELCQENHLNEHKKLILLEQIDTFCIDCGFNNKYSKFCFDDNISFCHYCSFKHKKHHKFDFDDIVLLNEDIEFFKTKIEDSKKFIEYFKQKIDDSILWLNKEIEYLKKCLFNFEEKNKIEIQFVEDILETYIKKKEEKNLNFQIYNNLIDIQFNTFKKNFNFEFKLPDFIINIKKFLESKESNILLESKSILNQKKKEEEIKAKKKEENAKKLAAEKKAKEENDKKKRN